MFNFVTPYLCKRKDFIDSVCFDIIIPGDDKKGIDGLKRYL